MEHRLPDARSSINLRSRLFGAWRRVRDLFGAENAYVLFLASLVGAGTGFGAIGFRKLLQVVTQLSFGDGSLLEGAASLSWPIRLLLPAIGLIGAWALTQWLAKEAKGHGVPEVMEAVALKGGRIRARVMLVKSAASALTIGTGGSVGREGPIVQIGSSIGSTLGQVFRLDAAHVRLLVACGAAAGIAATFNAPLAGVAFAVEIILGSAAIRTFSPIVVASVIATAISRWLLGNAPAFVVPVTSLESELELINYVVLGLVAGLVGVGFIRMLYNIEDRLDALPGLAVPVVGGLLVGVIGLLSPEVYGLGYETIEQVLHQRETLSVLAVLVVAKMLATSLTLGGGGSGGIFAPSLFIGATLGGFWGDVVNEANLWPTAAPPAYALVGMAAVVAATTHAPLTAIIIIFELTSNYTIILPVMLATITASVLSISIQPESIYTLKLVRRGISLRERSRAAELVARPVREVMAGATHVLPPELPFGVMVDRVLGSVGDCQYVVDPRRNLLGVIHLNQIKSVIRDDALGDVATAYDAMAQDTHAVDAEDTIEACLQRFSSCDLPELPVVEDGKLVGVIRRGDILDLYNRELLDTPDLGLMFVDSAEGSVDRRDYVQLPEGHGVEAIEVPPAFVGKALQELDLRGRYGLLVVGMRRHAKDGAVQVFAPDPQLPLDRDTVLIIEGPKDELARLQALGSTEVVG
jgi:CIC family chloride channel protein